MVQNYLFYVRFDAVYIDKAMDVLFNVDINVF